MNSRFCFCFKRNRASYNISSKKISYTNSNEIISTITSPTSDLQSKPHYENLTDSSDDRQIDMNNEYLTSTTSMKFNGHMSITSERLSQPLLEDYSELYATVDKTKRAKNSIRKNPETNFPVSITNTSPQRISSEHPPRTVSLYANIPVNTQTNNYENISSRRRRSYHDQAKPHESFPNRDQRLEIDEGQVLPISSRNSERYTPGSSDLYAEIVNGSASGTIYRNHQSKLHSPLLNGNQIDDNISEGYATIK